MEDRDVQKDYKKLFDELILKEFDINNFHIQALIKKEPKEHSEYLRQLIKNDYSIDNLREISNRKLSSDKLREDKLRDAKPSSEEHNQKFDFIPKSYEEVRSEIIQIFNNLLLGNTILLKSRYNSHKNSSRKFNHSNHNSRKVVRQFTRNVIRQSSHIKYSGRR